MDSSTLTGSVTAHTGRPVVDVEPRALDHVGIALVALALA